MSSACIPKLEITFMDNTPQILQQKFTLCSYMVHVEGNAAWNCKLLNAPLKILGEKMRQVKAIRKLANQISQIQV